MDIIHLFSWSHWPRQADGTKGENEGVQKFMTVCKKEAKDRNVLHVFIVNTILTTVTCLSDTSNVMMVKSHGADGQKRGGEEEQAVHEAKHTGLFC